MMDRLLLTLLVVVFFGLCVWGMRHGWRRQAREQSVEFPPFPEVPADPGRVLDEARGSYVATTRAGHWQERVVTRGVGLRGNATLRRYAAGVEVDRDGAVGFWIPRDRIERLDTASGMAGKVMGTRSLLTITWRLGDASLDTGFKANDISVYARWLEEA